MSKSNSSFWYRNSLSIALFVLAVLPLIGQAYTGWKEYLKFLEEHNLSPISLSVYLTSGHFLQTTFENWESEFFQMAIFVVATIFLRQKGSSESKPLDSEAECDKEPKPSPDAPWPVRKGGLVLQLYKHSLSITLTLLFIGSFALHLYGSWKDNNLQHSVDGLPYESVSEYIVDTRFWFESFQNWQSVFALIVLSIYLRQIGSPQSKPVDASHDQTGE
jgi:hypothetical protein